MTRNATRWILATGLTGMLSFAPLPAGAVALEQCISEALQNSPDIGSAAARVDAARAMLRQANSAYYPWVNLSGNYARTDNPPQAFMMSLNQRNLNMADPAFDPNNPDDTENLRGSLGVQWRLFDSGRREADRHMAKFGTLAAAEGLAAAQNQLAYEVTRGFYGSLQARAFSEVQAESVKSIEESLRTASERFNAGSAVKTDVLNLETQLAQAREDLIRAKNGFQLALAALNTAIGSDFVTADSLATPSISTTTPPPADKEWDAVENRPEWKAAQIMTKIKEQALKKARRGYGPTVSAFASSDWDSDVSSDFEQSYMAGVVAEVNLFDGFRTRGAIASARAEYQVALADEQRARNNLKLDLTQAFLGAREAWERLDVTRKSQENAEEALRITREQYEQGAADIAILLQAQVGVTAMKTRAVSAQYDYLTAIQNLKRAKGELVQEYLTTDTKGEE